MNLNEESWSWEPAQDILDYLKFAGFDVTRDQLARLHRRRLISQPFHGPAPGRGSVAMYPAGTAERMLRISQLKESTKQLDELSWRLWWEGFAMDPELIRAFLSKKAARWDEQLREVRVVAAGPIAPQEEGERDVLDEVFFQHLKVGPSLVSARKQLGRGSEIYIGFAGLLMDLLQGDLATSDANGGELFAGSDVDPRHSPEPKRLGQVAREAMRDQTETSYVAVVDDLDDKEVANSRTVALRFLRLIASVGTIVQEVFGGVGRGRDNIGRSLIGLAESPDEQVLSLLLTSSFLKDDVVRESLSSLEPMTVARPVVTYQDYLRIRYLVTVVDGLDALVTEPIMRLAFESPEEASRWRRRFEEFLRSHELEIDEAIGRLAELFDEEPPDDVGQIPEEKDERKKKNPK